MKRQKKIEIFASSDTEIVEMAALFFELDKYYEDVQLSFLVSDVNTFGDSRLWQRIDEYKKSRNLKIVVYDMVNFVEFQPVTPGDLFQSGSNGPLARFYYAFVQKWWLQSKILRPFFYLLLRTFNVCKLYLSTYKFHLSRLKRIPAASCFFLIMKLDLFGLHNKSMQKIKHPNHDFPFTVCNQEEAIQTLRNNETVWFSNNPGISKYFPKWRHTEGD